MYGLLAAAYLPAPGGNWAYAAKPLLHLSNLFLSWGSDEGGMSMSMEGIDHAGRPHSVQWSLFAGSADGPQIPATPAVVLAQKLARGGAAMAGGPGARACVDMISYDEVMQSLQRYDVVAYGHTAAPLFPSLAAAVPAAAVTASEKRFACEDALSTENLRLLPKFMRDFHTTGGLVRGQLTVSQGDSALARFIARVGGLPRAATNIPVVVHSGNERWTRYFGAPAVATWDRFIAGRVPTRERARHSRTARARSRCATWRYSAIALAV